MGRARHQRDAGPGRDHVKLLHSSWRAAGARGRRRGEGGAAGACLDAARRAGGKSHGEKGGGVHRWPPDPLGQLWRAPRRQAVRRQAHRHRAAEADHPLPARRRAGAARRHPGQGERKIRAHAARAHARHAARPRGAAARPARLRRRRQAARRRRELDCGHSRRPPRAQGRLRRRRRARGVGRGQGRGGARGDVAGKLDAPGQCRPVRAHARREDDRYRDRRLGRCGVSLRKRGACGKGDLPLPLSVARTVRPELRARRRRAGRRTGDLLHAGYLQLARHARDGAGPAGREGAGAVSRGFRHLRPQLLRRCRAGGGGDVAGRRQAGARAVHALGRARLGRLRPCPSR